MDAGSGWLTTEQAARRAGIKPDTLRHYAAQGLAPAPTRFGRSLMWDPAAITHWLATRPGRGTRTDLHPRA
ncbi:MerR family DNA-binding transcriptional regulator [Intrasporangium sp.]|uniref:MerR family transcriptional regulator n=1 Tax=Intrasporangium sp. TaxID=1925024 RepID=UPI003221DCB3